MQQPNLLCTYCYLFSVMADSSKMSKCTIFESILIMKTLYESNKNHITIVRVLAKEFKVHFGPDWKTITQLIEEFEHTRSISDNMSLNVDQKETISTPSCVEIVV